LYETLKKQNKTNKMLIKAHEPSYGETGVALCDPSVILKRCPLWWVPSVEGLQSQNLDNSRGTPLVP